MDSKKYEVVFKDSVGFCTAEIVEPLMKYLFSWIHIDCFKVFTVDLAELLEEKLPEHFAMDYKPFIGEYYYSALFGDPISTEFLVEIITGETVVGDLQTLSTYSDDFEGLEVYFSDHLEAIKQAIHTNGILNENRVQIEHPSEIIIVKMIDYLNSSRE